MTTVQIGGVDRPIAFNFRALRLFKERTGESLFGYMAKMQADGDADAAAVLLLDEPEKASALVWALLNGPQGSSVDIDDVESALDLRTFGPITVAIAAEVASQSPEPDKEAEGNEAAATETKSLTSASTGPSDAAA